MLTASPNDLPGSEDSAGNSDAQALVDSGEAVLARHPAATESARIGLPGLGQAPARATQPLDGADSGLPDLLANREAVSKSVLGLLRVFDASIQRKVEARCSKLSSCSPEFVAELKQSVALSEPQGREIADLTATVAEKWGVNLKYAPECALLLALGGYIGGIVYALNKLKPLEQAAKN